MKERQSQQEVVFGARERDCGCEGKDLCESRRKGRRGRFLLAEFGLEERLGEGLRYRAGDWSVLTSDCLYFGGETKSAT